MESMEIKNLHEQKIIGYNRNKLNLNNFSERHFVKIMKAS